MPTERTAGKPTTRRYLPGEKRAAVRMVRSLQVETGMSHGAVKRVARQLGYGVESVRSWVTQADIEEGVTAG
jgi:transposase-like protein